MLPDDIIQYVERHYLPKAHSVVLELLSGAAVHDGTSASPRVLRCILVAAAGDLDSLRRWVCAIQVDYRDVILAGEYVRVKGAWVRVRDLRAVFTNESPVEPRKT